MTISLFESELIIFDSFILQRSTLLPSLKKSISSHFFICSLPWSFFSGGFSFCLFLPKFYLFPKLFILTLFDLLFVPMFFSLDVSAFLFHFFQVKSFSRRCGPTIPLGTSPRSISTPIYGSSYIFPDTIKTLLLAFHPPLPKIFWFFSVGWHLFFSLSLIKSTEPSFSQ